MSFTAVLSHTSRAILKARSGRGSALVDRVCPSGSLGRGTFVPTADLASLVAFLNVDLEFGVYEVPKALDALTATLHSGLQLEGWESELSIADPECRGGLWAALRCWPRGASETNPGAARVEQDAEGQAAGGSAYSSSNGTDQEVVQIYIAENMTSTVAAADQPAQDPSHVAIADDIACSVQPQGEALQFAPVDMDKALQQQRNLLSLAERRARRQARRGGEGQAADWAWTTKLSYGVAEAQQHFWSRQPAAALQAARAAHDIWHQVLQKAQDQEHEPGVTRAGVATTSEPGAASGGGKVRAADDVMLHLLDVMALYACKEVLGQPDRQAGGQAQQRAVLERVFEVLAKDYAAAAGGGGLRIQMPEGVLSAEPEGAAAGSIGSDAEGHEVPEPGLDGGRHGLVVPNPCFPVQDLFMAACESFANMEGTGAREQWLRRLAADALQIFRQS